MQRLTTYSALLIFLAAAAFARADTNVDAVARAKAIAPVVEDGTIFVVHLDLSRIPSEPLMDYLGLIRLVPSLETWSGQGLRLSHAGVKDLYLVAPSAIFSIEQPRVLMAIPVASREEERMVRGNLHLMDKEVRRVGHLLLIGSRLPPPRDFRPADRPELTAAFEAAGDTAAQVILIPPACTPRVVEELVPELPPELGGGPSSVLTRGIRWAALGINASPHKALRLVIKSEDAGAAQALREKLADLLRLAGWRPEIQRRRAGFSIRRRVSAAQGRGRSANRILG